MTDRELMQQALDALNRSDYLGWQLQIPIIKALRARLAQPEQEPVAKMREMLDVQGRDGTWNYDPYLHGMYNGMEFMVALAEGRDPVFREAPERWLHTPPQREWQGLTDEEIREFEIWLDDEEEKRGWNPPADIVKYIEAKLKEKNEKL